MSTDLQLKGDSRRRQLDGSRAYAEANNLELAEGTELEDIGVSAFKGANAREGALGRFLAAIKSGSIKPGSYLIVESLDRLSREQVLTAQSLFLSIIQAGINLVTLMDGRVYRAGMTDLADLITSLVIMSRAHEESLTKSRRIAAAWKNKRATADQKPMTKWCPAWLTLTPDRSGYVAILERVEVVRQIFSDTSEGIGMYSIASRLNKADVATFGGPNGWHQSYIAKILGNRAVLGEFQPHSRVEGKRVAQGEPIKGYYPAIIDEGLFHQAQLGKAQRRGTGAGRKGTGFANLFSGIARCAYCRAPILFENKGGGRKGGAYLICDNSRRRRGCPSVRWRYRDFEATFLAFVEELNVQNIIAEGSQPERRKELENKLSALKGELLTVGGLMEKTYAVLNEGGPVGFVTGKLNELEKRRLEVSAEIEIRSAEQEDLQSRQARYSRSKDEIQQLVDRLQNPANEELFKIRAQIASHLKVLVEILLVGSLGEQPRMQTVIVRLNDIAGGQAGDVSDYMKQLASRPEQSRRFFAVGFRDSNVRIVFPSQEDPLQFQQQITADKVWGVETILPDSTHMGEDSVN
jgi:DNA invertase Pin-like site-specific DNA recombinase